MDYFSHYFGKSFESITVKDIVKYFKDEHTESNRLEFKSYRSGSNFNEKIKQIISSICAFLNSEGGLIIWGAPEGKSFPNKKEKIFIGSPTFINEYLEHDQLVSKISDSITPLPSGVSVRVIGQNNQYLYLFNIQASMIKPHQFDNKYMIRLDGQSRIAPHYYIEAMFRQIKYPDLEGFIKFGDIRVNITNVILTIETIIFNWSPLQNEKNVIILIRSPHGKFYGYNPKVLMAKKYQEYGLDGHESLIRRLDDILFYGSPFQNFEKILFEVNDIKKEKEVELMLRFGGENSPQKESYYKFCFCTDGKKLEIKITEIIENKLISDISGKASGLDHSWPDQIDHQKPELSACCLVMYVNCNLTGQMWSICPAFAPKLILLLNTIRISIMRCNYLQTMTSRFNEVFIISYDFPVS